MKTNFYGLDVLRGFGIFTVLILHSAFYYFDDIYEVDFNNPPLIVTVIGLLLMFAGLFAMISGFVHTKSTFRKRDQGIPSGNILKYGIVYGLITLAIAYLYFLFTGPGLIDFNTKSMNNSILVELIRHGDWVSMNRERLFYIDSLVMIGTNILLLALFAFLVGDRVPREKRALTYILAAMVFMALSVARIHLYGVWQDAQETGDVALYLLLNPLVAKNNPILPFFAFGLMGGWLAALTDKKDFRQTCSRAVPLGLFLMIAGILLYANLEDTMLERAIDGKWYSIMVAQLGLFMLLILAVLKWFDYRGKKKKSSLSLFFARFSKGGLTAFFLESVVSAVIYRVVTAVVPGLSFGIAGALFYGFLLALFWGLVLRQWEKAYYRFTLEYGIALLMNRFGRTRKLDKLQGTLKE